MSRRRADLMISHFVVVLIRGCEVFIILWFCPSMLSPSLSMVSTGCQLACEKPLSRVLQAWLHPSWCFVGLGQWDIYIYSLILFIIFWKSTRCFILFLYLTSCTVLSCCVVLWHRAKLEAECTSDHWSSDRIETQYSHSWWRHKHWIDLKLMSSAAVLEQRHTPNTHVVRFRAHSKFWGTSTLFIYLWIKSIFYFVFNSSTFQRQIYSWFW